MTIRGDFDRLECAELVRLCCNFGQPERAIEFVLDGVSPDEACGLLSGESKVRAVTSGEVGSSILATTDRRSDAV